MKVPFDALTVCPKISYEIVKKSEIQPLLEDGFPDNANHRFTVYYLELEPENYLQSEPYLWGITEFIIIFYRTLNKLFLIY